MGHTNSTANLALPQFIGTDKPTWLGDVNGAFSAIDAYAGTNDAAVAAAVSDASSAISQASAAVNTANTANTTAGNASTAANNAIGVANTANAIAGTVDAKVGLLADLNTTDRTSIVNSINEVDSAVKRTDVSSAVTQTVTHTSLIAYKTSKELRIDGQITGPIANNTKIAELPAGVTFDSAVRINYMGGLATDGGSTTFPIAILVDVDGSIYAVNGLAAAMNGILYDVTIPIQ